MLAHPRTGWPFCSPVPPGIGWPGDLATADTPVAPDLESVSALARATGAIADLDAQISVCRACPRLVTWREEVAVVKRRAFAGEPYWGRPVPGWGSARPRLLIVGLAPAANGANRTGRVFTGDRSGDQLFAALHRCGLVNQATSVDAADGLRANKIRISAAVRCAPPGNAPTPAERATCAPWLDAEWRLIREHVRVVVALGGFAWQVALTLLAPGVPKPKFGHGAVRELSGVQLLGCYHPSQQNMFTGRLTPPMLDGIFTDARRRARI
jgi:uracil-DNA glycosylase family 4